LRPLQIFRWGLVELHELCATENGGVFPVDAPAEQEALAEVYAYLCLLYNYWYPSFRLTGKEKQEDGWHKKIYEKNPGCPTSGCVSLLRCLRKARWRCGGGKTSVTRWN
jgi:hypothetical protein